MKLITLLLVLALTGTLLLAQEVSKVENVEAQPLIAQVKRVTEALDYFGAPISGADKPALQTAINKPDSAQAIAEIQNVLDKYCLFIVSNPESRVKVDQGPAKAELVEQGWRTFLVKVRNSAGVTAQLKAESENALPVYARSSVRAESRR